MKFGFFSLYPNLLFDTAKVLLATYLLKQKYSDS